jgi:hypothetical protein
MCCQRGGKLQICLKTTINETGCITNYLDGTDRRGIGADVRIIFTATVKCIPGNLNTSFFLFFIASFLYELYEYKNI